MIQACAAALRQELGATLAAGGPAAAIDVRNLRAPEIADAAEEAAGWRVGRSSRGQETTEVKRLR